MTCLLLRLPTRGSLKYSSLMVCKKNLDPLGFGELCPYCRRVRFPLLHSKNPSSSLSHSTYAKLNDIAAKTKKKRKLTRKYVEFIEGGNLDGGKALEKLAKIKKLSLKKTLSQLGIPTSGKPIADVKKNSLENTLVSQSNVEMLNETLEILNASTEEQLDHEYSIYQQPNEETFIESNIDCPLDNYALEHDHEFSASEGKLCLDTELLNSQKEIKHILDEPENDNTSKNSLTKTSAESHKKKAKSTKQKAQALAALHAQKLVRKSSLIANLMSYADVCVNNKLTTEVHNVLMHHHRHHKITSEKNAVNLYNLVLHGWANEGDGNKIKELLAHMEKEGPKPTLQSYMAAIQCVMQTSKNYAEVKAILDRAKNNDLVVENIFLDCKFVRNQKELVLQGIQTVYKNFNPKLPYEHVDYSCSLLHQLNSVPSDTHRYSPLEDILSEQQLKNLASRQLSMECEGQVKIKSITKQTTPPESIGKWRKVVNNCESTWRKLIQASFEDNVRKLKDQAALKQNPRTCLLLHPYLTVLPVEIYVDLMMQEITSLAQLSGGFSPLLSVLQTTLGARVMEHYFLETKKTNGIFNKVQKIYNEYCEYFATPKLTAQFTPRHYWENLQQHHIRGPDIDYPDKYWPTHILLNVGEFLYSIIMKTVKIDLNLFKSGNKNQKLSPAFFTVYRKHDIVKIREEIKPHPSLMKLYRLANCDELIFDVSMMPMMSPPLPWSNVHSGGFLLASAKFIRFPHFAHQQRFIVEDTDPAQLAPTFDSLNQLGECPWKINEPILDLVIQLFNEKGCSELDVPQPSSQCPTMPKLQSSVTKQQMAKILRERASLKQKKAEMHSLWCDMLYKLSIANKFRKHIIWFPHNMDFRGRVYPCPPHFNHLGSDISRSLLLFAKGEKLGEKGLNWLKIHLINLTGLKKRSSLKERLKYFDEVVDDVMDSADKPLNGKRWWAKSDEPWQTLAACMEVTKALRCPSPHEFICHFPVHQDGSCNGLQHYAALGRDEEGAEQVNLLPRDVPQDVYSRVAEMVEAERAEDAENEVKIAQALEGFINRKVVKQPVMTTVYGVTRYGARYQILRQLKELQEFPQELQWKAAAYLVTKTFGSLQKMFLATKQIQDWLTESASLISSLCSQPVEWVTPLGLPIMQPYYKYKRIKYFPNNSKASHLSSKQFLTLELPNTRKQRNAFPPNYIHCLDSSHMMLTGLFCQRAGITYVSVHDCFWTHPSTVETMNRICREQFVALHSEPLLKTLSQQLLHKFIHHKDLASDDASCDIHLKKVKQVILSVPQTGAFDLKQVLKSTYFFS